MSSLWDFFISHWLLVFWTMIFGAFAFIAAMKVVEEVQFRIDRRRYRRIIR